MNYHDIGVSLEAVFEWILEFIDQLHVVTTNNHNINSDFHTLQITTR
jgi:hypothetical protein